MHTLRISAEQLELIESLLLQQVATLSDLLRAQVRDLPPGDDSWAATENELDIASDTLSLVGRARTGAR